MQKPLNVGGGLYMDNPLKTDCLLSVGGEELCENSSSGGFDFLIRDGER